jgi:hypothetical protein
MNNFKLEPFLWLHLSGLGVIPLLLEGVWLALSIGKPLSVWWLDFLFVVGLGLIPPFLLQWKRPFNIFSFLLIAIYPNLLTTEQCQILSLIKNKNQQFLQGITFLIMLIVLWQLYHFSPVASLTTNSFPQIRIIALIVASLLLAIAFFFAQVASSVLKILFTSQEIFIKTAPYATERIYVDFTTPPFFVKKIITLN